jgi:uncharacterized protein (TIGR03083 family)
VVDLSDTRVVDCLPCAGMAVDHMAVLRDECARVSELARDLDHSVPIPHLPGWTVHDVVAHLAGDFLWVLGTLATKRKPTVGLVAVETRGSALCDEWDAVSARHIAQLDGIDVDEPCPNFAHGDHGRLGFHPRHQAFETMIHRWDIEATSGAHAPIAADVAVDAIDELFATYTVRYSPHELTAPMTLACNDTDAAWRVEPADRAGFVTVERSSPDAGDVTARAADLLLLLWQRIAPESERIAYRVGPGSVRAFLEGPLTA